jgi:hypothetical protein
LKGENLKKAVAYPYVKYPYFRQRLWRHGDGHMLEEFVKLRKLGKNDAKGAARHPH